MEESILDPASNDRSRRDPAASDLAQRDLGDFHLLRKIGAGGMGQVYLARQKSLKREVAVKILKPELAANLQALKRFRAEAEAVARINHANIVQIFAIGEQDGIHYMALEYVDGLNLREYLTRRGTPDLPIVLNIIRQVSLALQRAHEQGFVHRDIKPENILLTRKGEVKVADFGLSRCFADEAALHLTQSGVTMGTPLYMSPEQVQGKTVDPRSDIYSLGVTCWHMLAGAPPFHGATAFEVALQHVQNVPPSLAEIRPDLPPALIAMVEKMMAKPVEARYQTARDIVRDLAALREAASGANAKLAATPTDPRSPLPIALQSSLQLMPIPAGTTASEDVGRPASTRRISRIGIAIGVLAAAFVAGLGIHRAGEDSRPVSTPPTASPSNLRDQREKELLQLVGNRELLPVPRLNHILELIRFYIEGHQFDRARATAEFVSEVAIVPEAVRKKDLRTDNKSGEVVLLLAQGIILAYEDKAEDSVRVLTEALGARPASKLAVDRSAVNAAVVDLVRSKSGQWAQALADAIQRDVRNDPKLNYDRLRKYQHPTVVRPIEEPKKP